MQMEKIDMPVRRKCRPTMADALRDHFMTKKFDMTLGAYYPKDTIDRYNLTSAERVMSFTRNALERADYKGWYVMVVHDKNGSTLWHPHMLLDGRNNQFNQVMRQLHKFGDVRYKSAGPVQDLGSCAGYMANRACERKDNDGMWEFEYMGENRKHRARGSRGRGRSRLADWSTSDRA
ncbi:MAG: hypothetical protein U1E29_07185 [Coriobacteriia bacterium]|nr:hypothetical protein [Coriobacteriia bacterium]